MKTCTTCNKVVTSNHIEFKCPSCGKTNIVRCASCKEDSKEYKCKECVLVGLRAIKKERKWEKYGNIQGFTDRKLGCC